MLPAFDPQTKRAIDDAAATLASGAMLDARTLVAALCAGDTVTATAPALSNLLGPTPLARRRKQAGRARLGLSLASAVARLAEANEAPSGETPPIGPIELLRAVLEDSDCRRELGEAGLPSATVDRALALLPPAPLDAETRRLLASYGHLLDEPRSSCPSLVPVESSLQQLAVTLGQRRRRSAVVVAPSGTGKSVLVRELARRIATRDPSIPAELRDRVVFALQPHLLRLGTDRPGELEERVHTLAKTLARHTRVVLFVDDLQALFSQGRAESYQHLWLEIAAGRIACIACATPAEYRQHVAADERLAGCLPAIRLAPPTHQEILRVLSARLSALEDYYGVHVPAERIERVVALAETWLPAGHQPRTAIELLDLAAGACQQQPSPRKVLDEASLISVVEGKIGRKLAHAQELTTARVHDVLSSKLQGQEATLRALADAFVAKLGPYRSERGPLGVFLLAGPTGVGKTQAALVLADLLGGGRQCLVRVDANVLGGSDGDLEPAKAELFGPPPGYRGYEPGKSGLLARVRDLPESLVLFDEIEKAPPGVGDLLLQILGEGRGQDVDGEAIDFRRSFVVFTTNAGNESRAIIGPTTGNGTPAPTANSVFSALRRMGFGNEFLGRIDQTFVFQPLDKPAIRRIFALRLQHLEEQLCQRGRTLELPDHLADQVADTWQSRFGARHVSQRFERLLTDQLNLAESEKLLLAVHHVRVVLAAPNRPCPSRRIENGTLVLELAASDD